jgi:hypothetical protein
MDAKVIDLTKPCPVCGERMARRWDPSAKQYLRRGEDPGDYGCTPDHWICISCTREEDGLADEEVDERLSKAMDLGNWFFPKDMHITQRLMWVAREAYRIGLTDGRDGR